MTRCQNCAGHGVVTADGKICPECKGRGVARGEEMMTKDATKRWNIWNIRSRTLRALASWAFAAIVAVLVLVALPFAIVWLAVGGVIDGARALWADYEWRDLAKHWWRAATGKKVA